MATCLHFSCAEEIEETKLFCNLHWDHLSRPKQNAIFEAWMYGDFQGLGKQEDDNDSSGD